MQIWIWISKIKVFTIFISIHEFFLLFIIKVSTVKDARFKNVIRLCIKDVQSKAKRDKKYEKLKQLQTNNNIKFQYYILHY